MNTELIEREEFLKTLEQSFKETQKGEGHCIFVAGEAGIGKTSLIKAFSKEIKDLSNIYIGTCDALFAPRPLAPLYDVLLQLQNKIPQSSSDVTDRPAFFAELFLELKNKKEISVLIFEDIHWADEATLDFIKFLARRITQLRCLFILTYRDNEINSRHPLRNVLGQLSSGSFTRMQLKPLSKEAVNKLAAEKEYKGEDVYKISGGNPFYVNEILASYSLGVPDNIKDSILSVYNRVDGKTKEVWQILSVMPTGFELKYLEKIEPAYITEIETCLELKILIEKDAVVSFKHELYRRTIEASLSPLLRVSLNKRILDLFKDSFEANHRIERIIHHAKNANEYDLVVQYAPIAAKQAATVGAHLEAATLYLTAIEYYQGNDKDILVQFYNAYAYECYLTNQVKEAIIYAERSLNFLKEKNAVEEIGNCMRFLSRLWWFNGNRNKAEKYATSAIEVLKDQPASNAKAMALSNMSQMGMLEDNPEKSVFWGEQAIALARELNDEEILCHALNNVGDVRMRVPASAKEGITLLQQSLDIALKNSFHEHAARAYTNMGSSFLTIKDFKFAVKILDAGITYCEERDLDSWTDYMSIDKARVLLRTGKWNEALDIANELYKRENQAPVVKIGVLTVLATIQMRSSEHDVLPLLHEAAEIAFQTQELQRIIPAMVALLEYEWITGKQIIKESDLNNAIGMVMQMGNIYDNSEFAYWVLKARNKNVELHEFYEGYNTQNKISAQKAANLWKALGCPYEQALMLFEGSEADKKNASEIAHNIGADIIYEKMKFEMRASGIKNIPRGIRKSTKANPANLTERELDVLQLLKEGLQNKEIAEKLFISPKTVDHHISAIYFKLDVNSRAKAVQEASRLEIVK